VQFWKCFDADGERLRTSMILAFCLVTNALVRV
jgi:hypothetical protein